MCKSIIICLAVTAISASSLAAPPRVGDILVGASGGEIVVIDPRTSDKRLLASGGFTDFTIAPSGEIYAIHDGIDVVRIDLYTGSLQTVSSGGLLAGTEAFGSILGGPEGITANQNGLFVLHDFWGSTTSVTGRTTRIIQVDPATSTQTLFSTGIETFRGGDRFDLESDSSGNLFAAVFGRHEFDHTSSLSASIVRFDGVSGIVTPYPGIAANRLGLGVGRDDAMFIATTGGFNEDLYAFDRQTGTIDLVHPGLASIDVDVEEGGTLIVGIEPATPGSLDPCPGTPRHCLIRYDPGTREVLQVFPDIERVGEIQVVPGIVADVDIRPSSTTNSINPMSRGVIAVAILGTDAFDVFDVDLTSLAFGSTDATPVHIQRGHSEDVNSDGLVDLVSHYETAESGIAFGDTEACVAGELLDGSPFEGCDAIVTAPRCGIGFELAFLVPGLIWLRQRRGPIGTFWRGTPIEH